jgi:hypothetical protein
MLAETFVQAGHWLVKGYGPEGRRYWAARFWDREEVESRPELGDDFRAQKAHIAGYLTRYGADADRVLEFACGTGECTEMAARLTPAVTSSATCGRSTTTTTTSAAVMAALGIWPGPPCS